MSPQVDNFVHSLVEMAKAQEMLPTVQADLEHAMNEIIHKGEKINSLYADLEQSRTYAASLEQRCRDLEVARDDAELRFLELDEKAAKVLAKLSSISAAAHDAAMVIDPPKPEPVKEPEPMPPLSSAPIHDTEVSAPSIGTGVGTEDQRVPDPTQEVNQNAAGTTTTMTAQTGVSSEPATGQSESNPTASTVETFIPSASDASDPSKPYVDQRYYDAPQWISYTDWINGGGTDFNYHWRPSY